MKVRNELFETFSQNMDKQVEMLLNMESTLVSYRPTFAFGSNYYMFFTPEVKRQIFQIIFNENLIEFLSKRVDMILDHQNTTNGMVASIGKIGLIRQLQ